jgi:hypothetical protein
MSPGAWNKSQLRHLLERVMHESARDGVELDEEHMALLAEGRLDALSPPERDRLLRLIAADPAAGELLAELDQLGLRPPTVEDSRTARPRSSRAFYTLFSLWAAAACLFLSLLLWRAADPPAPLAPDGTLRVMGTSSADLDYWEQLDHQRRVERVQRDRYRDYALIISTGTGLVLSIGLVAYALRRKPGAQVSDHHKPADAG